MSTTDPPGGITDRGRSLMSTTDPRGGITDRGAESAVSERLAVCVQDEEVVLDYDTDSVL